MSEPSNQENGGPSDAELAAAAAIAVAQPSAALTAAIAAGQPSSALAAAIAAAQPSTVRPRTDGIKGILSRDVTAISNWLAYDQKIKDALGTHLNIQKILDDQNSLQKIINESGLVSRHAEIEALKMQLSSQLASPIKQIYHEYGDIARIAREHSAMLGTLSNSAKTLAEQYRSITVHREIAASFRLPRLDELYRVHLEHERWSKIPKLGNALIHLEGSLSEISTPWVRVEAPLKSIAGFVALQGVGAAVHEIRSFDPSVIEVLRQNLGDWNNLPKWPRRLLTDPVLRTEFYVQHSFNPRLTDFPEAAFDAGLGAAGLGNDDLGLLEFEPVFDDPNDAAALTTKRRATACFEILYIFEEKLRAFIDRQMTEKFGADWTNSRLPGEMRQSWLEKQAKGAAPGGTLGTLIDFADFTDYEKIICKRDNWREVFEAYFVRAELITTAFYFLRPIRLIIMHARKPSYNDELFLRAEVTKISICLRSA